jgi:hypothetical protein
MNANRLLHQIFCLSLFWAASLQAHDPDNGLDSHKPAQEMMQAARRFLAALPQDIQAKAQFDFANPERENWHFVPIARKGVPLKELSPAQHHLAMALLASGLSHRGVLKATTIMSLEQILLEIEQEKGPVRDPSLYFITVFGIPGPAATWGWRVEGHHLAINFTIVKGDIVTSTPNFFGTNPAEVRTGPRQGLRVLAAEEDLGRTLVTSLDGAQRAAAILSETAPKDILTGDSKRVKPDAPSGLPFAKLNPEQRSLLQRLVREYLGRARPELAEEDLQRADRAGWENVHFAWAGGLKRGEGHYYRVQGPTFLLEYDNTQNDANHIHTVWRDFQHDFGDDPLRRHYQESHHGK